METSTPTLQSAKLLYLSKEKTGLPFAVIKDDHFPNYFARYDNGMREKLTVSDIINIHLLMATKTLNDGK